VLIHTQNVLVGFVKTNKVSYVQMVHVCQLKRTVQLRFHVLQLSLSAESQIDV
jgi:hypothetical protein